MGRRFKLPESLPAFDAIGTGCPEGFEPLLDPSQLAELLGIRSSLVRSWVSYARGISIPHLRFGRAVRFRRSAIAKWILKREKARKRFNFL